MAVVVVGGAVTVLQFAEAAGTSRWLTAPLLLLGAVAVPSIGAELAVARREEIGLARLRGIHGLRLWRFLLVEPLLAIVTGTLIGLAVGAVGTVAGHPHVARRHRRPAPAAGPPRRGRHRRGRAGDRRAVRRGRAPRAAVGPGLHATPAAPRHDRRGVPQRPRPGRGGGRGLPQPVRERGARPRRPARPGPGRPGARAGRHLGHPHRRAGPHPGHRASRHGRVPGGPPTGPRRRPGHPGPAGRGCRRGRVARAERRGRRQQLDARPGPGGGARRAHHRGHRPRRDGRAEPDRGGRPRGRPPHRLGHRAQRGAPRRAQGVRRCRPVGRRRGRLLRRHARAGGLRRGRAARDRRRTPAGTRRPAHGRGDREHASGPAGVHRTERHAGGGTHLERAGRAGVLHRCRRRVRHRDGDDEFSRAGESSRARPGCARAPRVA